MSRSFKFSRCQVLESQICPFFFPFDLQEYNLSEFVGVCIELSIKSRLRQ